MSSKVGFSAGRVGAGASFMEKVGPQAPHVMIVAAAIGIVAAFLPAVTVSLLGVYESVAVWRDWRGKLALLGYVGVAVTAAMILRDGIASRRRAMGCAIAAAVVVVSALWLPLSIKSSGFGSAVSMGVGVYVNVLAALGMAAGAAIQARRSKLF